MFKIGELAREAGVPVTTVRYYERAGLLKPSKRSSTNYRLFGKRELQRLRFIRAAQAAGFTLAHVKILLRIREGRSVGCNKVVPVIDDRLEDIERRIDELNVTRARLSRLRETCLAADPGQRCPVITELDRSDQSSH